jgi:hypothetical protein
MAKNGEERRGGGGEARVAGEARGDAGGSRARMARGRGAKMRARFGDAGGESSAWRRSDWRAKREQLARAKRGIERAVARADRAAAKIAGAERMAIFGRERGTEAA